MSFHWAQGQRLADGTNELRLAPQGDRQDYYQTGLRGSCIYNGSIVYVPVKSIGNNARTALVELEGQRLVLDIDDLFYSKRPDPVLADLIHFRELEDDLMSENVVYETGAQRSADVEHVRYDLIHPIFAETIAEVLAEGAGKYGEHNWEQGFPMESLFNHLLAHAFKYLGGDRSEDHLGHMSCNIMFLVVEHKMRYNNHLAHLRGPGCTLTQPMLDHIAAFNAAKKAKKEAEAEHQQFSDRFFELVHTGTLKESTGIIQLPKLRDTYFPEYTSEALAMKLNQMGVSATATHVVGLQIDNCCHARNVCCKEGTPEQVEVVDILTKALQEGVLYLGEGSISTDELQEILRKDFKYPDVAAALRAFNLVLSNNRIEGISDPRAKQAPPDEVPTLQECVKAISELYESKVFRKSIGTSVRIGAVSEKFKHRYPIKMLVEAFQGYGPNIIVTYDAKQQDYILRDFGIAQNTRPNVTTQAPASSVDSIRDRVLSMFVSGELRHSAGSRLLARDLIALFKGEDQIWHAFNTIGFKQDGQYILDVEWKGTK